MSTRFVLALIIGASLTTAGSLIASAAPNVCEVNRTYADGVGYIDDRTLEYCVSVSNDGDIIEIDPAITQIDFSEELLVDKNITIDGTVDAGKVVFDALSSTERMIGVTNASKTLTLKNIKFTNADTTNATGNKDGGAVKTAGDLYLEDVEFVSNSSPTKGGAVYVDGDLYLDGGIKIESNNAAYGGAFYVEQDLIGRSGFIDSDTNASSVGNGGAIFVGRDVILEGSVNSNGDDSAENGGFLAAWNTVSIEGNVESTGTEAEQNGGFVFANKDVSFGGDITATNNSSRTGNGGFVQAGSVFVDEFGGTISSSGSVTISGTLTATNNDSVLGNGGFAHAYGDFIHDGQSVYAQGNSADAFGGFVSAENITLSGGSFISNQASEGGALYAAKDPSTQTDGNITITGAVDDTSNEATGGRGGFLFAQNLASLTGISSSNTQSNVSGGSIYAGSVALSSGFLATSPSAGTSGVLVHSEGATTMQSLFVESVPNQNAQGIIYSEGDLTITGSVTLDDVFAGDGTLVSEGSISIGALNTTDVKNTSGSVLFADLDGDGFGDVTVNGVITDTGTMGGNGALISGVDVVISGGTSASMDAVYENGGAIKATGTFTSNGNFAISGFNSATNAAIFSIGDATFNGDFTCDSPTNTSLSVPCVYVATDNSSGTNVASDLEITGTATITDVDSSGSAILVDGEVTIADLDASGVTGDEGSVINTNNGLTITGHTELSSINATGNGGALFAGTDGNPGAGNINLGSITSNGSTALLGGALAAMGNLTIDGQVITNQAYSAEGGGFAYVGGNTVFNSTVSSTASRSDIDGGFLRSFGDATFNGDITASGDSAEDLGGFALVDGQTTINANIVASSISSSSSLGGGGFIFSVGDISFTGDIFRFTSISANQTGGALHSQGSISITGELFVDTSSSTSGSGGFAYAEGDFTHSGGPLSVQNSSAGISGAFVAANNVYAEGGDFNTLSSQESGGAILAIKTAGANPTGGDVTFTGDLVVESIAVGVGHNGGIIFAEGAVSLKNLDSSSTVAQNGGSIYAESLTVEGLLKSVSSVAGDSGGIVYTTGTTTIGELDANTVTATNAGGAIYAVDGLTINGSTNIVDSSAGQGLLVSDGDVVIDAITTNNIGLSIGSVIHADFDFDGSGDATVNGTIDATTTSGGIGAYISGFDVEISGGEFVQIASSSGNGGAIAVEGSFVSNGSLSISNLTGQGSGGGIRSEGSVTINGNFTCETGSIAGGSGVCIRVENIKDLLITGDVVINDVSVGGTNGAIAVTGNVTLGSLDASGVDGVTGSVVSAGRTLTISGHTELSDISATNVGGVLFSDREMTLGTLTADNVSAVGPGGVIFTERSVEIERVEITNASAGADGGAIRANGDVEINGGFIRGTVSSGGEGGAIYSNGEVRLTNLEISNTDGAANTVGTIRASSAVLDSVSFIDNSASIHAAFVVSGNATVINSNFSGNTHSQQTTDGGMIKAGGNLEILNSTFTSNGVANDTGAADSDLRIVGDYYLFGTIADDVNSMRTSNPNDLGGNLFSATVSAFLSPNSQDQVTDEEFGDLLIEQQTINGVAMQVIPIGESSIANNFITTEMVESALTTTGLSQTSKDHLQGMLDGSAVDRRGVLRGAGVFDSGSFEIQELQKPSGSFSAPSPFAGPVVTEMPSMGDGVYTLRGSNLQQISAIHLSNTEALMTSQSDSEVVFETSGIASGEHEVKFVFGGSTITTEFTITIEDIGPQSQEPEFWTKQVSPSEIKLYAKNIVGAGKVQFFHNGNEVAWVNAEDASDPKLRLISSGPMAGSNYLVRTRELVSGKNVFEVYLDGERVLRRAQGN